MRPDERRRVEALAALGESWLSPVVSAAATGTIAMLIGTLVFGKLTGVRGDMLGIVALILFLGGTAVTWTALRNQSRRIYQAASHYYDADLRDGEVEEWQLDIRDAIQVEEFEDEGSQYFLELDDGRVLFLVGQYLYEHEAAKRFPCSALRLARFPHSREIIDIECQGAPLVASTVRAPFTEAEHRSGRVPEDGEILEGPLSRFREGAA